MARVYVWPVQLMSGVYQDLHGGNNVEDEFAMFYCSGNSMDHSDVKASIIIDLNSPLVPSGHITVAVSGRSSLDGAEADRSAAMTMVNALRSQYNIWIADYNYICIAENRALFNSMKAAVINLRLAYDDIESILKQLHFGLNDLCKSLNDWIRKDQPTNDKRATIAINALMSAMSSQKVVVGKQICYSSDLLGLLLNRDIEPEEQVMLDTFSPMPMNIQWDRSFFLLQSIFREAVKKLPGELSELKLARLEDGQFQATVDFSVEPSKFSGQPARGMLAAKAKLLYAVIQHVDKVLGHPIIDLHYAARQYQESSIRRFNHKMNNIWDRALKLREMFEATCHLFALSAIDFADSVPRGEYTDAAIQALLMFTSTVRATKERFAASWVALAEAKIVDSGNLEAILAAEV